MDNKELELQIKKIIENDNMFDMIMAAKTFEKDYKTSEFYKTTKMPILEVIKNAKIFYLINFTTLQNKVQNMINNLDITKLNETFDKIGTVFATENSETMTMLEGLKDFKDLIKKD